MGSACPEKSSRLSSVVWPGSTGWMVPTSSIACRMGADGRWQIPPDRDMQPGSNNFTVKAVDLAGNVSDKIEPLIVGGLARQHRLDGADVIDSLQDGGRVDTGADGRWQITPDRDMQPGSNNFTVKAVDLAGNVSDRWSGPAAPAGWCRRHR
jgi:hypothetical protein